MSSTRPPSTSLGRCPDCGTGLSVGDVLIRYRTGDDTTAVWADCPGCRDVVHPE